MAQRLTWGVLVLLGCAVSARAGTSYYLLVFGSQRNPTNPDYTHTWAVFVRASDCLGPPGGVSLESHVISWMPASMQVRTRALRPEPGVNLGLAETLDWALSTRQRVSLWGPFQIEKDLYDRALQHLGHLEGDGVKYKTVDLGYRASRVSNCVHGVSDITTRRAFRVLRPGWGQMASYYVSRRARPWIIEPEVRHEWVAEALGLYAYPITYREGLENPHSGLVWLAIRALNGRRESETGTFGPTGRPTP